jgi:hypothetical protein
MFNCLRMIREGGARRFMLPGFRFLLAAITLSISMLVFGLGAAALLRAAHEQFASNPSWHAAPEATFAQQPEPAPPILAMLHAEPPPVELKAPENVSALNTPVIAPPLDQPDNVAAPSEPAAVSAPAPEQASIAPAASEPDKVATIQPEQKSAPEPATPAKPVVAENPPPTLAATSQSGGLGTQATATPMSSSQSDTTPGPTKQAALAPVTPQASEPVANEAAESAPTESASQAEANAAAAAEASPTASPEMDAISTKLAALARRPLIVQPRPRPKAAIARAEQAAKKRLARQAALRRKLAAQARQAALTAPQLFAPFPEQLNQPPGPGSAPYH